MNPPINEAVFLLSQLDPRSLDELRTIYPSIKSELEVGKLGGEESIGLDSNFERGDVMVRALEAGRLSAETELMHVRRRIKRATRLRLIAQLCALVGTSTVLLSLGSKYPPVTVAGAVLALAASIFNTISDYAEGVRKVGNGNLQEAYQKASLCAYKAALATENLRLLIKYKDPKGELQDAIAKSNLLCEELAQWRINMSLGDSVM